MALNFPSNPSLNQTYSYGNSTWTWNGSGWKLVSSGSGGGIILGSSAPAAKSYYDAVMTDTPYLYWPLAESNSSAKLVYDASGNNRGGTYGSSPRLVNQVLFSMAAAPRMGLVNNAAISSANVNISGAFSIECIFRRNAYLAGQSANINGIIGDLVNTANGFELRWDGNNATLLAYIATGSGYNSSLTCTANDSTDYHIVVTVNGSGNGVMYLNGSSAANTSGITSPAWNSLMNIGHAEGRMFDGWVSHVAIYTTALSSDRVTAHYNARTAATPGIDGNFYIDAVCKGIYGPRATNIWPTVQIGSLGP